MGDFNLNLIAARLEGLEETILHKLIDRAQFYANRQVYLRGQSGFTDEKERSLLEIRLRYQERMDAEFGRFCVPEERPFTGSLPPPRRTVSIPDPGLHIGNYDTVNLTAKIIDRYLKLVPVMCHEGDDHQYGSSVEHDIYALQAIARRIHYGALYVAESKYDESPEEYKRLVAQGDAEAIREKLTRREVEEKIVARVRDKVTTLQATVNKSVRTVVDPAVIVGFYENTVIPLTKEGEILYLFHRET